jgi:Na+/H+-dicarboxylate symporter
MDSANIVGLVAFCVFFAYTAARLQMRPVIKFFAGMEAVVSGMMSVIMWCVCARCARAHAQVLAIRHHVPHSRHDHRNQ